VTRKDRYAYEHFTGGTRAADRAHHNMAGPVQVALLCRGIGTWNANVPVARTFQHWVSVGPVGV
jgi:hypothetical protein